VIARLEQFIAFQAYLVALLDQGLAVGCQAAQVGFQSGKLGFALGFALQLIFQLFAFGEQQIALFGDLLGAGLVVVALVSKLAQRLSHSQRAALNAQGLQLPLHLVQRALHFVALGGQPRLVVAEFGEHFAQRQRHGGIFGVADVLKLALQLGPLHLQFVALALERLVQGGIHVGVAGARRADQGRLRFL